VLVVVGLGNLKPAFNHIAGRLFLLRFCRLLDEIRELSKAVLSGVNNLKKGCDMDSGKECEIANGLEADGEGEMTNKLDGVLYGV